MLLARTITPAKVDDNYDFFILSIRNVKFSDKSGRVIFLAFIEVSLIWNDPFIVKDVSWSKMILSAALLDCLWG